MKFMKKDFVREDFFSLKERFNMMMTAMICFLNGILGLKDKNGWFVKELVGGNAADTRNYIHFLYGERIGGFWKNCSVWKKISEMAGDKEWKGNVWNILVGLLLNRRSVDRLVLDAGCEKRRFCMSDFLCRGSPPGWSESERSLLRSPPGVSQEDVC